MSWRERARRLRNETYTLYLALRDPRVPWYARALGVAVVGYALSPVDLIPDFIPFFGYLDDLLLVPLGIWLVLKLIPAEVLADSRAKATTALSGQLPHSRTAGLVVVGIWLACIALFIFLAWRAFGD